MQHEKYVSHATIPGVEQVIRWMTPFNRSHPLVSASVQVALFGSGLFATIAWMLSTVHR